ncbi:unnamed protein product [Orchesella dallaii]|uniref:Gustatory receptor n=1 Tax=Orchesella dallaii TaxID=48710 RepID=A0ABP1QZB0_9HEXA
MINLEFGNKTMFSQRLMKILRFRIFILQLGYCTPFRWDFKTNRLSPASTYSFWNFCGYTLYFLFLLFHIAVRLAQTTILKTMQRHQTHTNKSSLQLQRPEIVTADLIFFAIVSVVECVLILILQRRKEIIIFFNEMVDLDATFEEMFRTNSNRPKLHQQTSASVEFLVLIAAVSTLLIPFLFGLFFLQDTQLLHRLFEEVFEIKIKVEMQYLPHILFVIWSANQCCGNIAIILSIIAMYMKFVVYWITAMHPTKILRKGHGSKLKYKTELGIMNEQAMTKIYRIHQVLNRMFNSIVGNRLYSSHQATVQITVVLAGFLCIKYFEMMMFTPGYQLAFLAVFLCSFIELVETVIVSDAIGSSKTLQNKIKGMTKPRAEVVKCVADSWTLSIQVAYPYYTMERVTFLAFVQTSIDSLVTVLVASG